MLFLFLLCLFYISIPILSELSAGGDMVSVFGQLSSTEGKTGVRSLVISWKFGRRAGGPVAFFVLDTCWQPSAGTQDFFFLSAETCAW